MSPRTLNWDGVYDAARAAFDIAPHKPEISWVKGQWQTLADAGLTRYGSELERCEAAIRLMILASIYRDWCAVAWSEFHDDEPVEWASLLNIHPFYVGCLVGRSDDVEDDAEDFLASALSLLIESGRRGVLDALQQSLGGPLRLFYAFWLGSFAAPDSAAPDADGAAEPVSDGFLKELTLENLDGFEWIRNGCPPQCNGVFRAYSRQR